MNKKGDLPPPLSHSYRSVARFPSHGLDDLGERQVPFLRDGYATCSAVIHLHNLSNGLISTRLIDTWHCSFGSGPPYARLAIRTPHRMFFRPGEPGIAAFPACIYRRLLIPTVRPAAGTPLRMFLYARPFVSAAIASPVLSLTVCHLYIGIYIQHINNTRTFHDNHF